MKIKKKQTKVKKKTGVELEQSIQPVAGHIVKPHEMQCFKAFSEGATVKEISANTGVNIRTIYNMMKSDWWKSLLSSEVAVLQNQFVVDLFHKNKAILEAYDDILNDTYQGKNANAITKIGEQLLKISREGVRPAIDNKQEIELTKTETTVNIDVTSDDVRNLSAIEMSDWITTGKLPEKLIEQKQKDIIIEAEEVEDVETD